MTAIARTSENSRIMQSTDYDSAWTRWGDMIKHSPAPFHRRRLILRLAGMSPFRSVLDVGCGNGEFLLSVGQSNHGFRVVGIDISEEVVRRNAEVIPWGTFHAMDIGERRLDESFDLVICSEVLEHVQDPNAALSNLRAMCSGRLIVTVPAGPIYSIDRAMGHVRHFTPGDIRSALDLAGFDVEVLWRWGFPFHVIYKHLINAFPESTMRRFAGRPYSRADRLLARFATILFYLNLRDFPVSNQIIACARAKDGFGAAGSVPRQARGET